MNSSDLTDVRASLLARLDEQDNKADIMKAPELKALYAQLGQLPVDEKAEFGKAVNQLKQDLLAKISEASDKTETLEPIDITASQDVNTARPGLLPAEVGSIHPLMQEVARLTDVFERMGFNVEASREIDDQYNMFEALNFPKDHPARDDYDTFMTEQKDSDGEPLVAPAHTSTMQNRVLKQYRDNLDHDESIAVVVPDRVFRNEDLDARHEHTFYQVEGVYVAKGVHAGMLIATLQEFLQEYYGKQLEVRVNPFYFPFTEPSFEMSLSCPFCDSKPDDNSEGRKDDCKVCSGEGWIELLGCGMIHPNVLKAADIDPEIYTGFAFGCGIDRLVMMKYGIEDVRHSHSAKLDFLRQF